MQLRILQNESKIQRMYLFLIRSCRQLAGFKITALAFVFVLCQTSSYGQLKTTEHFTLQQIRQNVRQINSDKNYKVVNIDDPEDFLGHGTDHGGSLTGYYKGDSLKKIVEWVGLSNRVVQNEYFFTKGQVVFVYSMDKHYRFNNNTGKFDYSSLKKTITGRYYFSNDSLIQTILSDKQLEKTKQQDAAGFLLSGKAYAKILNERKG